MAIIKAKHPADDPNRWITIHGVEETDYTLVSNFKDIDSFPVGDWNGLVKEEVFQRLKQFIEEIGITKSPPSDLNTKLEKEMLVLMYCKIDGKWSTIFADGKVFLLSDTGETIERLS